MCPFKRAQNTHFCPLVGCKWGSSRLSKGNGGASPNSCSAKTSHLTLFRGLIRVAYLGSLCNQEKRDKYGQAVIHLECFRIVWIISWTCLLQLIQKRAWKTHLDKICYLRANRSTLYGSSLCTPVHKKLLASWSHSWFNTLNNFKKPEIPLVPCNYVPQSRSGTWTSLSDENNVKLNNGDWFFQILGKFMV